MYNSISLATSVSVVFVVSDFESTCVEVTDVILIVTNTKTLSNYIILRRNRWVKQKKYDVNQLEKRRVRSRIACLYQNDGRSGSVSASSSPTTSSSTRTVDTDKITTDKGSQLSSALDC
ncbi:unnamed protein product [Amoebophrya sp. A25]|nr:unnamed protein product [Amoebophrya sp. A25]|eukprot:GSA25T00011582001.1